MREKIGNAAFPEKPGVYVVYRSGSKCPLYVGVAGTQTIRKRWRRQHLRPRAGSSALRRSLAPYLNLVPEKLRNSDGRKYAEDVEAAITAFLEGCEIEFHVVETVDEADDLEVVLREKLHPELNISRARRRRRVEKTGE